jgi:hypothetical protein
MTNYGASALPNSQRHPTAARFARSRRVSCKSRYADRSFAAAPRSALAAVT